jgi:hypothetical protein
MLGMSTRTATILPVSLPSQWESPCREPSRSGRSSVLLKPRAMLTTAIVLHRMLSEIFASSIIPGREAARTNRRGQDKSRKVRPVGWWIIDSNFRHAPNIANIQRNLSFLPRRCSCSVFDTLRRAR